MSDHMSETQALRSEAANGANSHLAATCTRTGSIRLRAETLHAAVAFAVDAIVCTAQVSRQRRNVWALFDETLQMLAGHVCTALQLRRVNCLRRLIYIPRQNTLYSRPYHRSIAVRTPRRAFAPCWR